MATELAKAYVQIVPSAEGIKGSISSAIGPEADDAGKSAGEKISGGILSGISSIAKVGTAAIGAASTAIGAALAQSVSGFAEQEQLIGGVQKLYGNAGMSVEQYAESVGKSVEEATGEWQNLETAQNLVLENARNAYKTAGMDMNTYMDSATSFSASLISSLNGDTVKAAEQTDVAMRAISDNFNTFGGDISSIQNAYQGFAKQNYTMLDNLKLGYGGTKSEMERLIQDAEKVDGTFKAQRDSSGELVMGFSDIVTAIQKIQEQQGIAGTTAREASTTIAGSFGMLKAAWSNLVTGFSDKEADLNGLMKNVVDSVVGYTDESGQKVKGLLDNVMPVIETALGGIGKIIEKAGPIIAEKLPGIVSQILPGVLSAATSLLGAVIAALPGLAKTLADALPVIWEQIKSINWKGMAGDIIGLLKDGFNSGLGALGGIAAGAINILTKGFSEGIPNAIRKLQQSLSTALDRLLEEVSVGLDSNGGLLDGLVKGITEGIPKIHESLIGAVGNISEVFFTYLPGIAGQGREITLGIARGLLEGLPDMLRATGELFNYITEQLLALAPDLLLSGVNMAVEIGKGMLNAIPDVMGTLDEFLQNVFKTLSDGLPGILSAVQGASMEVMGFLKDAITQHLPDILEKGGEILRSLIEGIGSVLPDLAVFAAEMISGFAQFILESLPEIIAVGADLLNNLITGFGEAVPELLPQLLEFISGIVTDITENFKGVDWFGLGVEVLESIVGGLASIGGNLIETLVNLASDGMTKVKEIDWVELGKNIVDFIAEGIQSLVNNIPDALKKIGETAADAVKDIDWMDVGKKVIGLIGDGIHLLFVDIPDLLTSIGNEAVAKMAEIDWAGIGSNIISGICGGIADVAGDLIDSAVGAVSDAWDALTGWLNIASPSKKARDVIGRNWALGIGEGFEQNMPETEMVATVKTTMSDMNRSVSAMPDVKNAGIKEGRIIESIKELKAAILSMQIVMDSGETVGAIFEGTDRRLGREALRASWQ